MITEDYVSFNTAKLLKEKGFDWEVLNYFNAGTRLSTTRIARNWNRVEVFHSAPTLQMAMKWLREVHKLQVSPRYDEVEDEKERLHYVWFFDILSMSPYKMLSESEHGYNTYEEACEVAIKYCLENLI